MSPQPLRFPLQHFLTVSSSGTSLQLHFQEIWHSLGFWLVEVLLAHLVLIVRMFSVLQEAQSSLQILIKPPFSL